GSPPTPGFVTYTSTDDCLEVCGDGLVAGDETCDNGRQCQNGTACTENAQCAGIGDGQCQVRAGDGCSATCRTEVGWSCEVSSAGPQALHQIGGSCSAICGDRLIRIGEQCDDGNVDDNDGCSSTCVREAGYTCPCSAEPGFVCGTTGGIGGACGSVCGDGGVIGFEECDDGRHCLESLGPDNLEGTGDDVLRACSTNGDCLGTDANAECKTRSADGCNAGCRTELGWECPTLGGVCLPACGDFVIRGVEVQASLDVLRAVAAQPNGWHWSLFANGGYNFDMRDFGAAPTANSRQVQRAYKYQVALGTRFGQRTGVAMPWSFSVTGILRGPIWYDTEETLVAGAEPSTSFIHQKPAFWTWNARLEAELRPGLTGFVAMNNMFNVNQHALFIALDRSPFIGSPAVSNTNGIGNPGNSMPGREIVAGLQARF
ncbi:MAG TPA: TonB-dependent receptor, partial [Myxococcota bacterium]|nr:TonB-dependent receptor [Myxococcota bacterium]